MHMPAAHPKIFCLAAVQRSDGWDHAGVFHAGCALRGKGAEASHVISEHCCNLRGAMASTSL